MGLGKKEKVKKSVKIADLEKGIERRDREKLIVKDKVLKPSTIAALSATRTIVWLFIASLVLLGIYQLAVSKRPKIVENIYRYEFSDAEGEKGRALALSFVKEYLTFGGSQDNYSERVKEFIVSEVTFGNPMDSEGKSKVLNAMVWEVEKINEDRSNIIIKADVELVNSNKFIEKYNEQGKLVKTPVVLNKTYYVSVPIGSKDGKVIIDDYPAFLPPPEVANLAMDTYTAENSLEEQDEVEVKKTLNDFLQVYYSGTSGQIKYFFAEDPKLKGLEGEFIYSRIVNFISYESEKSKATAVVVVEANEKELGTIFNQRYLFNLTKVDGRWIINKMENRGTEAEK